MRRPAAGRRMESIGQPAPAASEQGFPIGAWEHRDIQQPVAQVGGGKEIEMPAVVAAVAYEDQFALSGSVGSGSDNGRFFSRKGLESGDHVRQRADCLLVFPVDKFDG